MSASTTIDPSGTDRIVKTTLLKAPRAKVWRALTDPAEFSRWFGCDLKDPFVPGARVRGPVTSKGYEHLMMDMTIERVEPPRLFSWRWQPGAMETIDQSEPTTLVVFELEEVPEGTRLTVTESGFERVSPTRRPTVYRENEQGWAGQLKNLTKHLAGA
jgi:uncharacterized protein YndB with AHSA1/START domain